MAIIILLIAVFLAMQIWTLRVGLHRYNIGDYDGALLPLKIARLLNPFNEAVPMALAGIDIKNGNFKEAENNLRAIINKKPDDAKAHNLLGVALQAQGLIEEALAEYNKAIEQDPNYAIAHMNRGYIFLRTGRLQEGMQALRLAVELDPKLKTNTDEILKRLNLSPAPAPESFSPGEAHKDGY